MLTSPLLSNHQTDQLREGDCSSGAGAKHPLVPANTAYEGENLTHFNTRISPSEFAFSIMPNITPIDFSDNSPQQRQDGITCRADITIRHSEDSSTRTAMQAPGRVSSGTTCLRTAGIIRYVHPILAAGRQKLFRWGTQYS